MFFFLFRKNFLKNQKRECVTKRKRERELQNDETEIESDREQGKRHIGHLVYMIKKDKATISIHVSKKPTK